MLNQADLFFIICLVIPFSLIGTIVAYKIIKHESGSEIAEMYARKIPFVLLFFALIVFALGFLATLFSKEWIAVIQLLSTILLIASFINLIVKRNRLEPSDILLVLRSSESKVMVFGGAAFLFSGLISLPEIYSKHQFNLRQFSITSFLVTAGCFWLFASLSKVYVTKNGISRFLGFIPWDQITNHEWSGNNSRSLIITIKKHSRLILLVPSKDIETIKISLQTFLTPTEDEHLE